MLPQAAGACQDRYNLGFAYGMAYGMPWGHAALYNEEEMQYTWLMHMPCLQHLHPLLLQMGQRPPWLLQGIKKLKPRHDRRHGRL